MYKILIVEDEISIAELIDMQLTQAGYTCTYVTDGEQAGNILEENSFDLILLDIMLPIINGYELMGYIEPMKIPVIFLTAKDTVKDKIKGIKMGADDYITKPFDMGELLARVEMVLRRYGKGADKISFKDLEIYMNACQVRKNGEAVSLTPKEFKLLTVLIQNKNNVMRKEDLYEKVWEKEYVGNSRTVDLHVQRLRNKTGLKDEIRTVFKIGYMLTDK